MSYLLVIALLIEALSAQCSYYQQCYQRTISTTNLYCYGNQACYEADLTGTTAVYLYGYYASLRATITAPTVYIDGYLGANYGEISATTVHAYGRRSANYADITPIGDAGSVTVNFYSYQSGYLTDVTCQDGQTCVVNCLYPEACYDVQVYCYSGSSCSFTQSCADASSTAYCLDVHNANTGGLTDVDIRNIYLENKKKRPDPVEPAPVDNPDDPDQPDMPYQPVMPYQPINTNPKGFGNYYLSLTNGQFALFSLLCAVVILASIGLCVYNLSDTAKRFFVPKEDFN